MFQTRIHGRGGQGVVTAAELLSIAAFIEGRHAQAFPSFGSERTGAPVVSYCRIDDKEIRTREPILEPDAIIIQDPTLFTSLDVFQGLKSDGYVLLNSNKNLEELGVADEIKKIQDHKISGDTLLSHRASIEELLEIDPDWDTARKKRHLSDEYNIWNNRLNTLPEGGERENAQQMLNLISEARAQYDRA